MDNCFIILWLSSLDFQVTISNKARFMIFFFINILNVQVSIIILRLFVFLSNSVPLCFKKYSQFFFFLFMLFFTIFFFLELSLRFWSTRSKNFLKKNFLKFIFTHFVLIRWNSMLPPLLSKTKIQFLHKFIYFYFLIFSNLGSS